VPLAVVQDPNGKNTGQATWTYNIADGAFDFLAAGETLTLTYMARVDNNYAPNNETTFVPFTIVITGTNDKPTLSATGGTITERIGTGNTAVDTVTGSVTFADVDLTDRPVVSAAISATDPFRYYDAQGHDVTATLTPAQLAAILAVEVPLSVVQATGNTHNGSASWTYSIADSKFDFIAKGETLTLNYVAQVDDGHGGVVSTPITVSIHGADVVITGTNDVPTIATTSDAFAELSNLNQPNPTGSTALHTASGTIGFTDVDLTDRPVASAAFTTFSYLNAYSVDVTSQLTAKQLAAISAVDEPLTVVQSLGNTNVGSASWSYSTADGAFDFLAYGEILTLTYTATVDDGHGGVVTKPITITVAGSNDTVEITSGAQTAAIAEVAGAHGSYQADTANGSVKFADVDLTDTHEVTVTGVIPAGLPLPALPTIRLRDQEGIVALATGCMLLAYIEGVAAARAFATKHQQTIDPRRELLGLAAANIATAAVGGYPVAGGLSQTAVNEGAGARSRLSLVFASLTLALCLLFFTTLLANLPKAMLAAVVLMAVSGLVDFRAFVRMWRASRVDPVIALKLT
jgi:VCBS repeat-containing protein